MASSFRIGEADLNSLARLVFESPTHSRRVYAKQGDELKYIERNGHGGPRVGACTAEEFRVWCSRRQVRSRPATRRETARDWKIIRAMPGEP